MKRLTAGALVLFIITMLILPCQAISLESAVPSKSGLTVEALLSFSGRLGDMIERYSDIVAKGDPEDPYNTARLIVKASGEIDTGGALGFIDGWNGRICIQYASAEEAERAAARLKLDHAVKYAVPDTEYRVEFGNTSGSPLAVGEFNSWGYGEEHVDMAALQERVLSKYGGEIDNLPEIIVAVCDSGVNISHEFLTGRTVPGYDFVNGDNNPADGFGHGTFCAGVVADGTLPNVKIMPLKCISDNGSFSTSDVVSAVEYAYLHGCAAANLSLIEYNPYVEELYEEVINEAADAGMVCCVASGNWSQDASNFVPVKIERAFTVAAHDAGHGMWPLSNTGDCVDITAPGVDILSTTNNGGMDTQSGTSFAAPHAAACCAMIKTYDPELSADSIMELLKASAIDEGYTGGGTGRLYVGSLFADGPQMPVPGDVDGSGSVTVSDALLCLRCTMGILPLEGMALTAADVDQNGSIDVADALLILRFSMGLSTML